MKIKHFNEIMTLFWPIAIAIILQSLNSFIDSVMISNYNVLGVSAINAGTQIMVAFGPVFFAMMTGINIFTVQYYARKEYDQLKHLVGVALTLMIPFSLLLFAIIHFYDAEIMNFFIKDSQEVVNLGIDYLIGFKFYLVLLPFDMLFMYQFRAIKKPKIPLVMGIVQTILNVIFNFIFIYGMFGGLEYGIMGAGISTALSRGIVIIIYLVYSIKIKAPFIGTFKETFSYDRKLFTKVSLATIPLIIIELGFGFARVLLTKVFALTGVVEFTAYTIASRTSFLINALVIATANVAGILVGGALSREDENIDEILRDLFKFMFYSSGVIILLSSFVLPLFTPMFGVSQDYYSTITLILIANGIYMALRVFVSSYISILKAGADNYFVIFLDAGLTYLVSIPLIYIGFFVFKFSIVTLVFLLIMEMAV